MSAWVGGPLAAFEERIELLLDTLPLRESEQCRELLVDIAASVTTVKSARPSELAAEESSEQVFSAKRIKLDWAPAALVIRNLSFASPKKTADAHLSSSGLCITAANGDDILRLPLSDLRALFIVPALDVAPARIPNTKLPPVRLMSFIWLSKSGEIARFQFRPSGDAPAHEWTTGAAGPEVIAGDVVQWVDDAMFHVLNVRPLRLPVVPLFSGRRPVGVGSGNDPAPNALTAYIKAREGILFFFAEGILFAFRKPMLFFPRNELKDFDVDAVMHSNVDLAITPADGKPVIFSMIPRDELDAVVALRNVYLRSSSAQTVQAPLPSTVQASTPFNAMPIISSAAGSDSDTSDENFEDSDDDDDDGDRDDDDGPGDDAGDDGSASGSGSDDEDEDLAEMVDENELFEGDDEDDE